MGDHDVTITLKVVDNASATLDNFSGKVDTVMKDVTGKTSTAVKESGSAFDTFGKNIAAGIAGFATIKGIQLVGDIVDLGQQSVRADQTFSKLVSTMGRYEDVLQGIRDATGNVVDDKTLETSANKLMTMGIAKTPEDLEKILGIAVKLGGASGIQDATKAIDDFTMLLGQTSIMRLDNFGISSTRVRERIKELQEQFEGLSREDAFRMATMEAASDSITRLGDAADGASTPINRLMTDIRNKGQDLAEGLSISFNSLLGMAELAAGHNPIQIAQKEQAKAAAQDFATTYGEAFKEYAAANGIDVTAFFGTDANLQTSFKSLWDQFQQEGIAGIDHVSQSLNGMTYQLSGQTSEGLTIAMKATFDKYLNDLNAAKLDFVQSLTDDRQLTVIERKDTQARMLAEQAAANRQTNAYWDAYGTYWNQKQDEFAAAQSQKDIFGSLGMDMSKAFGSMGFDTEFFDPTMMQDKLSPDYMKSLVPDFMQQGAADVVSQQLADAQQQLEKLKELSKQKLVSDESVQNAQNMVDNLSAMNDAAQKAADALANLNLATAFGQKDGGMKGEITDLVTSQLKASGASEEQIAAMQAAMDMGSGRETESSMAMKNIVVPMMAKMSAEAATNTMKNLDAFLTLGVQQGLSQEQLAAMMPNLAEGGSKFDLTGSMPAYMNTMTATTFSGSKMFGDISGMDEAAAAGAGGKGKKSPTAAMAGDMSAINKDSNAADKNFKNIEQSTTTTAKAVSTIEKALNSIPDLIPVTFKINLDDPNGVLSYIRAMTGAGSMSELVRDHGGVVPGASNGKHTKGGGQ